MKNTEDPWSGRMTTKNTDEIVNFLNEFLSGKSYAMTVSKQTDNFIPEVKTNICFLPDQISGESVTPFSGNSNVGFKVHDSSGVWEYSTSLAKDKNEPGYDIPYFQFNGKTLVITLNCRNFGLYHRTITVQERDVVDGKLRLSIEQKSIFRMALYEMYKDSSSDLCHITELNNLFQGKDTVVSNIFEKFCE